MKLLTDPALFNWIILTLYLLSAVRWAVARDFNSSICWLGAFIITSAVTWRAAHP